jgi:hypothetical protein
MAGRTLNRLKLRKEAEQPITPPAAVEETPPAAPARRTRKAAPARKEAAPRKPASRRAPKVPPRLRARWGVFDASMKQVAVFDYNQRAAAEEKVVALTARSKGLFFLKIVKVPMENGSEAAQE